MKAHLSRVQFITVVFLLMIATYAISGCGGGLFTYKGGKVTQQNLIVQLEGGNHQGEWKTNELAITYEYQMTPETLKITGTTELVGGFAAGFSNVGHLAIYLLLLDNHGIVIENALIYAVGNHHSNMIPMLFEKTLPVPEGAQTISFAYDGALADSGRDGGSGYNIWLSPSR